MFPSTVYIDRRRRLAADLDSGLLLFLGNDESPMNYAANTLRFRQDSTFLYYFGIDQPSLAALIDLDEGRTTVFADDASLDDVVWTGLRPTVAERALAAGVTETAPAAELGARLQRARADGREPRFLPAYRAESRLKLLRLLGVPPDAQDAKASVEFIRAVVAMRAIKGQEEIAEIEHALDTTVQMHRAALSMVRPGVREAEIAAKVTEIALASGGDLAFPIIATVRGETLHNPSYENTLRGGELFLLDAGAESTAHYAGDLTSTFPVDATFTPRQRDVYDIVFDASRAALRELRPGVPFIDVHLHACRSLSQGLKALGLMRGDLDEAVAQGAHALFFPCGLGHMMGLDVHDMEDLGEVWVGYEGRPKSTQFGLKSLRLARPLQPGFVLTVEPGIYFIPQLIDRWRAERRFVDFIDYDRVEAYREFGGVRIEENFLVTADGSRTLGPTRPTSAAEVEAARAAS
jgi:Xaa-Pro aminopeptidase